MFAETAVKLKSCIFLLLLPVPDAVCSLDLLHSHFHMFFKVFPCRELLDRISLIHKYLEFPLSKQKIVGIIDCGKLFFLTMQNYVAH